MTKIIMPPTKFENFSLCVAIEKMLDLLSTKDKGGETLAGSFDQLTITLSFSHPNRMCSATVLLRPPPLVVVAPLARRHRPSVIPNYWRKLRLNFPGDRYVVLKKNHPFSKVDFKYCQNIYLILVLL
jgi:hypothetical protein